MKAPKTRARRQGAERTEDARFTGKVNFVVGILGGCLISLSLLFGDPDDLFRVVHDNWGIPLLIGRCFQTSESPQDDLFSDVIKTV